MVKIFSSNREEFMAQLQIKIALHQQSSSSSQQVLSIELSDEQNPIFVYSYQCSEGEFHLLKQEEKLALDFQQFIQPYLPDLLNDCFKTPLD